MWVRIPVGHVLILAVSVLPAGPGPTGPPVLPRARLGAGSHRDMHAGVNRNPSLDHGWLVRTEL